MEAIDTRTTATESFVNRLGENFDYHFCTDKKTDDINLEVAPGHQPMMPVREEMGQIWSMLAALRGAMCQSLGLMQKAAGENEKMLAKIENNFAGFVDFAVNRAKEAFTQEAIAKERTRQKDQEQDDAEDMDQDPAPPPRKDRKGKGRAVAVTPALPAPKPTKPSKPPVS